MALVFSYIRFSTKKQLEGDSLRRQVDDGEAWISHNKHTLADMKLRDLGVSAFRGKNKHAGALSKFLDAIQSGRVKPGSILLVENLDRLSREGMNEAKKVFEQILEAGVLVAVLRPYERLFTKESIADPFGLMEPLMAFHLAYLESKNKADRLRKLWDRKRADAVKKGPGYTFDRRCPSWVCWDEDKKTFILNDGAAAVRYIFEKTAEGVGQRQVLAGLQSSYTPIGLSGKWNGSFIQKVLNDRAVLGERQPMTADDKGGRVAVGAVIVGYYPAVIDEALWLRAQTAKANNLKKKGPNGQFVNLVTGIVYNAHDGLAMHIQTTRAKREEGVYVQRRLVSYGHDEKLPGADPVSVAYFDLEEALLRHLAEIRAEDLGSKTGVTDLRAKEQEFQGADKRLNRLEADLATATDDDEYTSLRNAARLARQRRNELKEEVERLKAELHADQPLLNTHDTLRLLAEADDEQRHVLRVRLRSLIAELVESIYLKPEKHFGRVYCLGQVNYQSGLVRQFGFGPGWETTRSNKTQGEAPCCLAYGTDLRDKRACKKPKLRGIAELVAKPASAPVVKSIPSTIGPAADLFLAVERASMAKASFRVVPAKIRRFVNYVGADLECRRLGADHWKLFIRWLQAEVADRKLAWPTATVAFNRVREFVAWLIEKGATPGFGISGSAKKIIPQPRKGRT
jgi:DNA invertase Pin-like site-specific DNA recombinase